MFGHFPLPVLASRMDGWLYLARPVLALGVVGFAFLVWWVDRHSAAPADASVTASAPAVRVAGAPAVDASPSWWVEYDGHRYPLTSTLTIGRAPDCTLVLQDAAASARHAAIVMGHNGRPQLEDLGSRNGTLLQGQLITLRHALTHGDEITIGDVTIHVRQGTPTS